MSNQVNCVKYLDAATLIAAWIRQITVVIVCRQTADASWVWRRVTNRVQHLHITNVVNIQRLLQTDHESLQKITTAKIFKNTHKISYVLTNMVSVQCYSPYNNFIVQCIIQKLGHHGNKGQLTTTNDTDKLPALE